MGHRANFAVVRDGKARLYYSQWGAVTLPLTLLFGPEYVLRYAEDYEPTESLRDSVWCGAAALLEPDARRLIFFFGDSRYPPGLRRHFLRLVPHEWPGWTVHWADQGLVDVALALRIDPDRVRSKDSEDRHFVTSTPTAASEDVESVITVVRSGAVADYGFDDGVTSLLAHGPGLMDRLQGPGRAPLIEHEDLGGGALLDADRNALQVWWAGPTEDRVVDRLARLWPGWTVRRHTGGLRRQVELSGRDAADIDPDEDEAARRLVAVFFEDSALDPREVRRLLLKDGVRADRGLGWADSAAGAKDQIAAYLAGVLRARPGAGP